MVVGQGGAAFFYFLCILSRLPDVRCCFPVGVGWEKANAFAHAAGVRN